MKKILSLILAVISSIVIMYLYNPQDYKKSDFIGSIIFAIILWIALMIQEKMEK